MNRHLIQLIGYLLSLPGSVLAAAGLFSLFAHFTGREGQYKFVMGTTSSVIGIVIGLLLVVAGVTIRKRNGAS